MGLEYLPTCMVDLKKIIHGWYTPRNINIEPENDGLEDDSPLPGVYSEVPC